MNKQQKLILAGVILVVALGLIAYQLLGSGGGGGGTTVIDPAKMKAPDANAPAPAGGGKSPRPMPGGASEGK